MPLAEFRIFRGHFESHRGRARAICNWAMSEVQPSLGERRWE
jgi:hypothetical protein